MPTGGMTGGEQGVMGYEMGDAYVGKFLGTVVINGVLYYNSYQATGGTAVEQTVHAVNLKTGEELWVRNWNNSRLAFRSSIQLPRIQLLRRIRLPMDSNRHHLGRIRRTNRTLGVPHNKRTSSNPQL